MKKIIIIVFILLIQLCYFPIFARGNENSQKPLWTVMIYMNGDNDLDSCVYNDMTEIEKIGSNSSVNIVIQADRFNKTARRYLAKKNNGKASVDDWGCASECLGDIGEVDMGDFKELVRFFDWSVKKYPAEKYALIIWNHGTGWKSAKSAGRSISFDDTSKNAITTVQLGAALNTIKNIMGKNLDLLVMDACLMQMIEVLAETKDCVNYVCASEDIEPAGGMPYEAPFRFLIETPSCTSREFAKVIVKCFYNKYYDQSNSKSTFFTYSAVDCLKLTRFLESLKKLIAEIEVLSGSNPAISTVMNDMRKKVQRYSFKDYADIGDMLKFMKSGFKNELSLMKTIDEINECYKTLVLINVCGGANVANSTGISIYLPNYAVKSHYRNLKFGAVGWNDFIIKIFGLSYIDSKPDSQMH